MHISKDISSNIVSVLMNANNHEFSQYNTPTTVQTKNSGTHRKTETFHEKIFTTEEESRFSQIKTSKTDYNTEYYDFQMS